MARVSIQMLTALVRDINVNTAYHIHFERYGRQGIYARVTQSYEETRPHFFKSIGEAYEAFKKILEAHNKMSE